MKTLFIKLLASQIALAATLFAGSAGAETLTLYTSQPEADAAKTVDAFKKAQPGVQVQVYNANHGFNCDQRASYNQAAATLARTRTLAFFGQHLG